MKARMMAGVVISKQAALLPFCLPPSNSGHRARHEANLRDSTKAPQPKELTLLSSNNQQTRLSQEPSSPCTASEARGGSQLFGSFIGL